MNKQCIVCGVKVGSGLPYHNHMLMHERRGEAKAVYTRMGGPPQWVKVYGGKVDNGPLFEKREV